MATPPNEIGADSGNQPGYTKWILIGCGIIVALAIAVVIVAAALLIYLRRAPEGKSGRRPGLFARGDVKLVDNNGIKTVKKSWNNCTALAPDNWSITGNEQRVGIGVDLAAADDSMSASYGIVAVPRTQMYGADYYGTGTPERFLETMAQAAGISGFVMDAETRSVEGYTLRYWRANQRGNAIRGFVLYRTFESGDPTSYIIAYHMGATEASKWETHKNLAYDVAASIRCTKRLFPAQESSVQGPRGSSKDRIDDELSIKRQEATMGFQNVYSPSTGEHWEASYSDYNATGPDGPGYYRRVGNSYEKLSEGFPPG